ncbi:hypothetical protein, partial [Streptococcus suis]
TPLEKDSIQTREIENAEQTLSEPTNAEAESVATPLEKDSIQAGETEIAEPTSSKSTNAEAASVDNSEIHADTSLTAVSSVNLDNPVIELV